MSTSNFATPYAFGSPVHACQWSEEIRATPVLWCGGAPAYEVVNDSGTVFLSCVEHAAHVRTDPRAPKRLASMRSVRVAP